MDTRLTACLLASCLAAPVAAQTIMVVGTQHLAGIEPPPSAEQFAHTIEVLSGFEPTQVCVERMSGERIEALVADPVRHGPTLQPDYHGRPLASVVVPTGVALQLMLERRPAGAREEASELVSRWNELDTPEQIRAIGLQLAGFEFHSAVLNWSYLDTAERDEAGESSAGKASRLSTMRSSPYTRSIPWGYLWRGRPGCMSSAPQTPRKTKPAAS